MEIEARWAITEDYFRSYYRDWITDISKHKKWAIPIGCALILAGPVFHYSLSDIAQRFPLTGIAISAAGLYQIAWYFFEKRRWIKAMVSGSKLGEDVTLRFTHKGVDHSGPRTSGHITWDGFKRIVASKHGMFLILQKGISIYVPKTSIRTPNGLASIMELFQRQHA
jgi:hypothetical protein